MTAFPPCYILRHGETEWNASGRLQGRFDSPLTPKGMAQARQQRLILGQCDLGGFLAISSPQGRAFETAKIAVNGLIAPITTDKVLSEIGLGEWAGKTRADVIAQSGASDGFALYDLAPGGEGFTALHTRCLEFLRRLNKPSVIVTHGITSRMLRLILTGQPAGAVRTIGGGQGVVFYLSEGKQQRLTLGA
ncbi:Phosphoglycerate mutase [Sulfitobacter noctilucae]|uniref:histidine phosphatase family protein n=1 Tax=Sulfitobacter noctilucae TaxID=1342302 RepID=UPI00046A08ED|nr:histidine phosphatase family protein [Sulfitobacter noctilucae]KIN60834.1 Phosphoglycerate mutase [Sulfitobacter noctilucae]